MPQTKFGTRSNFFNFPLDSVFATTTRLLLLLLFGLDNGAQQDIALKNVTSYFLPVTFRSEFRRRPRSVFRILIRSGDACTSTGAVMATHHHIHTSPTQCWIRVVVQEGRYFTKGWWEFLFVPSLEDLVDGMFHLLIVVAVAVAVVVVVVVVVVVWLRNSGCVHATLSCVYGDLCMSVGTSKRRSSSGWCSTRIGRHRASDDDDDEKIDAAPSKKIFHSDAFLYD
jgi:hypothetical protein